MAAEIAYIYCNTSATCHSANILKRIRVHKFVFDDVESNLKTPNHIGIMNAVGI